MCGIASFLWDSLKHAMALCQVYLRLLPALSVPARSGKLPGERGALAAPQTSHDGGRRQSCTPGRIALSLLNKGGGGTSHDAAGSGGRDLKEEAEGESGSTDDRR